MAWEEYKGNAGSYEDEEITFVKVKIGSKFEGTIDGIGKRKADRFGNAGDEQQTYFFTDPSGEKMAFTARKVLLERLDQARLSKGDRFRVEVEEAHSKEGRRYGAVTLLVDRASGEAAAKATEMPEEKPNAGNSANQPGSDEEPPF